MILPQNTEFHSEVNSRLIHSADFGECTAIGQVPHISCLLFILENKFGVGLETWLSVNHR